ncbi:hypothetical protein GQ600_10612 [Phytophthora cactorum]|nr:hypothetical protein GQ600_10612 [Phytophthora cactorum]
MNRAERGAVHSLLFLEGDATAKQDAQRLFSVARSTIRLDRHSLQPIMLESILFLKLNRSYWGVETVHECLEHDWDDEDEDATAN